MGNERGRSLPAVLVEVAHAAALARFLERADATVADSPEGHSAALADAVLAALFDPERHLYWSTACLHAWMLGLPLDHELHGYCACAVGHLGPKKPGTCKHCDSRCICEHHTAEVSNG